MKIKDKFQNKVAEGLLKKLDDLEYNESFGMSKEDFENSISSLKDCYNKIINLNNIENNEITEDDTNE